jgi:hypothetical protein
LYGGLYGLARHALACLPSDWMYFHGKEDILLVEKLLLVIGC